jgi:hypothetical protein
MTTLLEQLKEAFDIVIYEAPMVLSVPDTAVISTAMDGVLLVHNPARGNREVVIAAKQALERARAHIVGLIFNAVEVSNVPRLSSKYYAAQDAMPHTVPRHNGTHAETSAPPSQATRLIPVGQTRMSDGFAITIHRLLFEKAVDHTEAEPGLVFLIADVEISNTRDISLPFYTYATVIYRENPNKYGQALSKIYAKESQNRSSREEDIVYFDRVTKDIDNGFQDEEIIPAHSTKRGFIVYKISQDRQNYMFMYEHDHIDITIPLAIT